MGASRSRHTKRSAAALLAFVLAGLALPRLAPAQPFGYVTWSQTNQVVVVNTGVNPNVLTAAIPVGLRPSHLGLSPGGDLGYVVNADGEDLTAIDLTTNTAITTIELGEPASTVAFGASGATAYAVLPGSGSVAVIDATTHGVVDTIAVGGAPFGVAVTPDGRSIYVAGCATSGGQQTVCVVDAEAGELASTIPIGDRRPMAVAVAPNGGVVYATNCSTGVCVLDVVSRTLVTSIPEVGLEAESLAFSRDSTLALVPNPTLGSVSRIDVAAHEVVAEIPDLTEPTCVALTATAARAYVSDPPSDRVSIVNVAANVITGVLSTPNRGPFCVAIAASTCTGDCDGNRQVSAAEVDLGVRLVFDAPSRPLCMEFDHNGDLRVTANEITAAVLNLGAGCSS